jgi:hypothetical protein
MQKLCSECGKAADVSLCQILSTVGRGPRLQRCSASVPFCIACLQHHLNLLDSVGCLSVQRPLSGTFTALTHASAVTPNRQSAVLSDSLSEGGR